MICAAVKTKRLHGRDLNFIVRVLLKSAPMNTENLLLKESKPGKESYVHTFI